MILAAKVRIEMEEESSPSAAALIQHILLLFLTVLYGWRNYYSYIANAGLRLRQSTTCLQSQNKLMADARLGPGTSQFPTQGVSPQRAC